MFDQSQHKIPQVYLKQFGYLTKSNQWKISVLKRGEKIIRQKSIESFSTELNLFDLKTNNKDISRFFEEYNKSIEDEFNYLIEYIDKNKSLDQRSTTCLKQLIINLICRSDYCRQWVLGNLTNKSKSNFLRIILVHQFKNYADYVKINTSPLFMKLNLSRPNEVINEVLLFFIYHLLYSFDGFESLILVAETNKPWITSDNPIVADLKSQDFHFLTNDSEFYFPISSKYLVFIHHPSSNRNENPLKKLEANKSYTVSDEQMLEINAAIIDNMYEYIIFSGEVKTQEIFDSMG